jgi:CO/xanthine dehydrogenase FAD-binding subunit
MRPANFELIRPGSLGDALIHLAADRESTRLMAGGQSLLKDLRERRAAPNRIIDLSLLDELRFVSRSKDRIEIGALTTLDALANDPLLASAMPALVAAACCVGDRQIRSRATIGGNLVSGWSSDLGVVACAGRAEVILTSTNGERRLAASLLVAEGCAPDELIRAIVFPHAHHSAFEKLSRRNADPSLASAAAFVWHQRAAPEYGLAVGGAHSHPLRLAAVEEVINRNGINSDAVRAALEAAATELSPPDTPHGSGAYRLRVLPIVALRALQALANGGAS